MSPPFNPPPPHTGLQSHLDLHRGLQGIPPSPPLIQACRVAFTSIEAYIAAYPGNVTGDVLDDLPEIENFCLGDGQLYRWVVGAAVNSCVQSKIPPWLRAEQDPSLVVCDSQQLTFLSRGSRGGRGGGPPTALKIHLPLPSLLALIPPGASRSAPGSPPLPPPLDCSHPSLQE